MRNSICAFVSSWVRRNSSTFRTRDFAQSGMSSRVPEVLVPARNSVPDLVAMALIPNDAEGGEDKRAEVALTTTSNSHRALTASPDSRKNFWN